jgi:hypothetical protein
VAKKQQLTRTNRAYIEQFIARVEVKRSQSCANIEVERILADMLSDDATIRAQALRQICPCRMPWEVFEQLRKAAKSLRKDPSPLVRANALHIEEDAKLVASFEATLAQLKDREQDEPPPRKRDKPWRQR